MTGFRVSAKGGAGIFDVRPDIVTYGKVLGGGFPIGAVGGRSKIMKTKNIFYGGTFSANPLSMYAAKIILETIIDKTYIKYDELDNAGETFRSELNKFFISHNKKMRAMGCGAINRIIFTNRFIINRKDRDLYEPIDAQLAFSKRLKDLNVFVNSNGLYHLSMSHTPEVIEKLIDRIKEACVHFGSPEHTPRIPLADLHLTTHMNDEPIKVEDTGIESLFDNTDLKYDDSILYLGGRIDDDNLYPTDYIKYLNQKIKELNPKHIICHSHWYAWKYYDRGVLDESMKINTIVCNYGYLSTDTFDPINKEDYQGSHLWCIGPLIEKNPNIVFASYGVRAMNGSPPCSAVNLYREWFGGYDNRFKVSNLKYFTFDREYSPPSLTNKDLGHGSHGRNSTDGFAILTNLLNMGFKKLNIIGFTAFGSNEDDSNFTEYTTSRDPRIINRKYFQLETSEDQLAEADILRYWVENKKIYNLENYEILTKHLEKNKS